MSLLDFKESFSDYIFLAPLIEKGVMKHYTWENSTILCRSQEFINKIFFITAGKGNIYSNLSNGKEVVIETYFKGSIVGDVEFILKNKASCNFISVENLEGYILRTSDIPDLLKVELFRILSIDVAGKFLLTTRKATIKLAYPLDERISYFLLYEYKNDKISMEKLALSLNSTYRHMRRVLKSFEDKNIIKIHKRKVTIVNYNYLENKCDLLKDEFLKLF